jgi:Tfp pilus assembly protein PilV
MEHIMKTKQALPQKGFVLIEALVAIVVVMVGALGIIKLNAVLLGGTGLTKTQAEALQLAQQRIEVMRNYVLSAGCVDSTTVGTNTTATNFTGTNANFRIDTVVTAGTIGSEKVINACVAWDGSSDACSTTSDKRVILKSSVACSGVGTSGLVNEASSGSAGGKLKHQPA